jgi:predicted lipoprotein with Yx(FWY)xxD motif
MTVRLARVAPLGLSVVAMGFLAAACGSTSSTSSSSSTTSATVSTSSSSYGTILTSGNGVTYYMFTKDEHDASACTGACAQAWHPVIAAHPTVAGSAHASLVGTIVRPGGQHQVTYDGHPLYTFVDDSGPHVVSGEGIHSFGGSWYVLAPSGSPITASTSSSSSSSSGSSGYASGY